MTIRARIRGASLLALALATPAIAQTEAAEPQGDIIDEVVDDSAAPAVVKTGDPVLDRLNELEAKVRNLEARNAELEQQAEFAQGRIEKVEARAAKGVQPNMSPTFADTAGQFSFKLRGVVDVDGVLFNERAGGYDYNDGTAFRRARLGFEGTAFRDFNYRLEVDFAGNAVGITDAYLQYTGFKPLVTTIGQHKAPFGLESNNSDNYNSFIERGMFTNAFGNAGAERRIGLSTAWQKEKFTLAVGVFGDNESISRSNDAPATATDTPDESIGVNGRVTWEPILDTGRILHVGASSYWRTSLKSGNVEDAVRLSDRPNIRVDNGNIADSGVITGVDDLFYIGAEAVGVFGPVTLAGEYGRLQLNRITASNIDFDGFYVYGTWFLTGETRPFRNGNFDRLRPRSNFDSKGGWGALELALRYDKLDLSDTPVVARAGNEAETVTLGLNWYLNPFAKFLFNWIRFEGDNTPLDPVGTRTKGDAFAARLHFDW